MKFPFGNDQLVPRNGVLEKVAPFQLEKKYLVF
jgi:hypothetical protein